MSDADAARDIRREVEAAGGSRWVPMRSVRDAFGRTTLTRKARGEIADALAAAGVLADPPLDSVQLDQDVRLFLVEAAPPPRYERTPGPVHAPPPSRPGLWQRFRAWPAWAQWVTAVAALVLLIGVATGDESSDDGGSPQPAEQASRGATEDDAAEEKERARERKRARARKRERARERERIRERRRERRREEARERRRREREARPPAAPEQPPEEEPSDSGGDGCDPNYSGCVPEYPPDVNCPEVAGPVEVIGDDPHGLDRDNDKVACE